MSSATVGADDLVGDASTDQLVQQIQQLVHRNSWRWKVLTVLEGVGLAVSALLAYLWIVFWLDNIIRFPMAGRIVASLGLLVCLAVLSVNLFRRWRRLQFTEDQVALAIERRTPQGVQNRLINALQIARSASVNPNDLSRAVISENVTQIQQLELEQAAAMQPAVVRLTVAALLVLVGFVFYFLQPDRFANAASRLFLPFGDVEPLYRTTLTVEPGDIEAAGDVKLRIEIKGERPDQLALLEDIDGKRRTESIPVPAGSGTVEYTLRGVQKTMQYAVRGGDYTTRFYQITVPRPSHLHLLKCAFQYPSYSGLADKQTESGSGEIQALAGTRVDFEMVLDQPCEETTLLIERLTEGNGDPDAASTVERMPLKSGDPTRFTGSLTLDNQTSYRIETRQAGREPHLSASYAIHVLPDQEPTLELTGLEATSEASVDASLSLRALVTDDLGLNEVGIFFRRAAAEEITPVATAPAEETAKPVANEWKSVQTWSIDGKTKWEQSFEMMLLTLDVAEGDMIEVALRATDHDPKKAGHWTEGTIYHLKVGGDAAALQLLYEQILRSEAELKQITTTQRNVLSQAVDWIRKLDGDGKLRWDDPKNIQALHAAMTEQAKLQGTLREQTSRTARSMAVQAGNLRLSVAMLADTEMVRATRILESVLTRDDIVDKRTALADLQLTDQRTLGSLQQIGDEYRRFRQDWELTHMIDFLQMLAERQVTLRDTSLQTADMQADKLMELRQNSAARRQEKLKALVGLSKTAIEGIAPWLEEQGSGLAPAFATAGEALAQKSLTDEMQEATADIRQANWKDAAAHQTRAAEQLQAIHLALHNAQLAAARQALATIEELAKSDLEAQKIIEKLREGDPEGKLKIPDKLKLKEIVHMEKVNAKKRNGEEEGEGKVNDYLLTDAQVARLHQSKEPSAQQFDILKLATQAGGKTPSFPNQSDRESTEVTPPIQEEFEDLVGDLLEEADEMSEKYETLNINVAFKINEPGEISKQGGDLNSTAASAATGNKKPPTTDVGGVSRAGRQGARSHGMVVGDESINRRGRDEVLEGQDNVPDQEGMMKEIMSEDPQTDTSTGVGGKKIDSKDTRFSIHDKGKWTDDMAKRMGKPQDKNNIVERQGDPLDPKTAEALRDLTSEHEQIIERVKSIRKELKNMYLPTDHLDEILAELNGQLDRMKERPTPELFRAEQQTLDKLRGVLRVFQQAQAGFQPSLPRQQVLRGHVLDEADRPPQPGYEQAVKRYYQKLSVGSGQ